MKKLLILTILCGLFSCNGNANPPDNGNLPDKKTMAIIKKAEKVVYYSLDPLIKDSTRNHIEGFCTTGFSKGLDKNLKDSLISIILENAKIPVQEDEGKFSAFLPVDVFQFIKGMDTVNFLVDLHCDIWKFSTNEKKFDFDALHAPMEKLIYGIIVKELTSDNMINNPIVKAECKKSIMPDSIKIVLQNVDSLLWFILDPMQSDDTAPRLVRAHC